LSLVCVPSAVQFAETPALVTPSHAFVAMVFVVEIRRIGPEMPAFVRMIVGSRKNGTITPPLPAVSDIAVRISSPCI
jgi:hypothetical protein